MPVFRVTVGGCPNHGAHYNGDLLSPPDAQLMNDVTGILSRLESGDPTAADQLLPLVYDELRKLAAARLARENPGQTLQATALVHDAYLRLVDVQTAQHWTSRGHFFRRGCGGHAADSRGEGQAEVGVPDVGAVEWRIQLEAALDLVDVRADEILRVHQALDGLAAESPVKAELVKLRFFGGLSHQEAAEALGISRATADRYWTYAKAWLFAVLEDSAALDGEGREENSL